MEQQTPQRKSPRLKEYDYRNPGHYFLTMNVFHRLPIFGYKSHGLVYLNEIGLAVDEILGRMNEHYAPDVLQLDCYAVMPDHVHLMVTLGNGSVSIPDFVKRFKTYSVKRVNEIIRKKNLPGYQQKLWQRSFYDHMIRNEDDFRNTVRYIRRNPRKDFSLSVFFEEYIPAKAESDPTGLAAYFPNPDEDS